MGFVKIPIKTCFQVWKLKFDSALTLCGLVKIPRNGSISRFNKKKLEILGLGLNKVCRPRHSECWFWPFLNLLQPRGPIGSLK